MLQSTLIALIFVLSTFDNKGFLLSKRNFFFFDGSHKTSLALPFVQ